MAERHEPAVPNVCWLGAGVAPRRPSWGEVECCAPLAATFANMQAIFRPDPICPVEIVAALLVMIVGLPEGRSEVPRAG